MIKLLLVPVPDAPASRLRVALVHFVTLRNAGALPEAFQRWSVGTRNKQHQNRMKNCQKKSSQSTA